MSKGISFLGLGALLLGIYLFIKAKPTQSSSVISQSPILVATPTNVNEAIAAQREIISARISDIEFQNMIIQQEQSKAQRFVVEQEQALISQLDLGRNLKKFINKFGILGSRQAITDAARFNPDPQLQQAAALLELQQAQEISSAFIQQSNQQLDSNRAQIDFLRGKIIEKV